MILYRYLNFGMTRIISKQVLRDFSLFSGLDDQEIASLRAAATIKQYAKGSVILLQGDLGDGLYLVLSGEVKVTILGDDGRELILGFLKTGLSFGETSLFNAQPRYASIVTTAPSKLLVIYRQAFLCCVKHRASLLTRLNDGLCKRLRATGELLADRAFLNAQARISKALLALGEAVGKPDASGNVVISKRPTQKDFAAMAGTTRETVSRVLNDLKRRGLIFGHGRRIVLGKHLRHAHAETEPKMYK